jgi:hypothetical protein
MAAVAAENCSAGMVIDNLLVTAVDTSFFSTFSFTHTMYIIRISLTLETHE